IDSLFDEFIGKRTLLKSIPSGIDETDCHPGEEICLTKRLLYNNSSPRPPEEIAFDNSNADIESFSPSPILGLEAFQPSAECPMIINVRAFLFWMFLFSISIPLDQAKYGGN
nr:hypothetical protein [Tanacetum cinerariifolium]